MPRLAPALLANPAAQDEPSQRLLIGHAALSVHHSLALTGEFDRSQDRIEEMFNVNPQ